MIMLPFLLLLLLFGILDPAASLEQFNNDNEHLITISGDRRGIATISVSSRISNHTAHYSFPNSDRLSPACGVHHTRCRQAVIRNNSMNGTNTFLVLVPLSNTVGLVEFTYDGMNLMPPSFHVMEDPIPSCIPLDILVTNDDIELLCFTELIPRTYISIFSIRINQNFRDSSLNFNSRFPISSISNNDFAILSNFVHYPEDNQLVYAVGSTLYGLRLDREILRTYPASLLHDNCEYISYGGDYKLYAYCGYIVVVYDLSEILVTEYDLESGLPFLCPLGGRHRLVIIVQSNESNFIEFSNHTEDTQRTTINKEGTAFQNGRCTSSFPVFYYVDSNIGVQKVQRDNSAYSTDTVVESCSQCKIIPIYVDSRYIIVATGSSTTLYKCVGNSCMMVLNQMGNAEMTGVIFGLTTPTPTTPTPTTPTPTTPTPTTPTPTTPTSITSTSTTPVPFTSAPTSNVALAVCLSIVALFVVGLVVTRVIGVIVLIWYNMRRCRGCSAQQSGSNGSSPSVQAGPEPDRVTVDSNGSSRSVQAEPEPDSKEEKDTNLTIPCAVHNGGACSNMVPANVLLPSPDLFDSKSVRDKINERTDTEEARNNLEIKMQGINS